VKNIKKLIAATLIGVFAVSAVGCKMVGKTQAAIDKSPVAKVNKDYITRGEFDKKLNQIKDQMKAQGMDVSSEQGKTMLTQQKQQLLDSMILEKIIMQKADELKLTSDKKKLDEEVKKQYDEIKKGYGDEAKFNEALKGANLTAESLKVLLKDEVVKSKVIDYLIKDVKVEDSKAKEYYDANTAKYTEKPNTIHLAHILTKTQEEAIKAKSRVDKGEAFDKVAKEMSTDTVANEKGGDLGEVNYVDSGFDETFMKAALAMKPGTISTPVKTQFGYHVIKCIEKKEYPVKAFDKVKDEIKKQLLEEAQAKKVQDTYAKWKKDAKIETKKYEKNLE